MLVIGVVHLMGLEINTVALFGSIILMHYSTWYVFYYKKLRPTPERFNKYLVDVFGINLFFIVLYIVYITYINIDYISFLKYMFDPIYFYCWTILHIITSSGELVDLVKTRIGQLL